MTKATLRMDTPFFSLQHFLGDQLIMPMPALFILFCMRALAGLPDRHPV
jgi:hypothetical protein